MNPVCPLYSAPINRVVHPTPHLLATGDDDGVIKVRDLMPNALDDDEIWKRVGAAVGPAETGCHSHIHATL